MRELPIAGGFIFMCEAVCLQLQGPDLLFNLFRTEVERFLVAGRFEEARNVHETSLRLARTGSFCWGGTNLHVNIHRFLPGELGWVGRREGTVPWGL